MFLHLAFSNLRKLVFKTFTVVTKCIFFKNTKIARLLWHSVLQPDQSNILEHKKGWSSEKFLDYILILV